MVCERHREADDDDRRGGSNRGGERAQKRTTRFVDIAQLAKEMRGGGGAKDSIPEEPEDYRKSGESWSDLR